MATRKDSRKVERKRGSQEERKQRRKEERQNGEKARTKRRKRETKKGRKANRKKGSEEEMNTRVSLIALARPASWLEQGFSSWRT